MPYSAFIMKATFLFIVFSLLCPFSLTYAMSCEEGFIFVKPSSLIKAKIFFKMSLAGEDLRRMDLRGKDLSKMNLEGANLTDARLEGANLWNANLKGANLREANLKRAFLRGAQLQGALVTRDQVEYLTAQGLSGFIVTGVSVF